MSTVSRDRGDPNSTLCHRDEQWSSWGDWSTCSFYITSNKSEADECAQFRERECVCPGVNGACVGSSIEVQKCETECHAEWSTS